MKKSVMSIFASVLAMSLLFAGCGSGGNSSGESSVPNNTASVSSEESNLTTEQTSSVEDGQTSSAEQVESEASSSVASGNTSKVNSVSNTSKVSSTNTTPPTVKAEPYVRFKLTGGDPSIERIILKDMDGKGFIGSCPLSYLNTQTNETIKNAEWKSDSKFRNYYHQLHYATKIYFDGSVDVEIPEEKSTLLKAELPMTIAAWIKPDGTYKPEGSPDFRVIAAYGSNNGTREHWDFKLLSDNTLSFFSADIPSESRVGLDSNYKVKNDVWTHVAVQVTKTGVTYFANGQKVDSKTFKSPITRDTNALGKRNMAIGALIEGAYSLRGGIAEFVIYKGLVDPKDTTSTKF